jgi:enoyl-CoA hydratase/carnithine racemase
MTPRTFRFELRDRVGRLTFARPKRINSLTFDVYAELRDFLAAAPSCRVLVLAGEGRGFCSGGDFYEIIGPLLEMTLEKQREFTAMTCDVIRNLLRLRVPTIAQLHGAATGAGAVIAAACDLRIAAPDLRMAFLFTRVGLSGADMGAAYLLPRIVGLGIANELLLTGRFVEAEEAARIGLVNRVVPADRLAAEVDELAAALARGPREGQAVTKAMIRRELHATAEEALAWEAEEQARLMQLPDFREAFRAFSEKREPRFEP